MKLASILYKVFMALTGLAWIGFLIGHLSGNLLLYKSPAAFDAYGRGLHELAGGALVTFAEVGLVVFFVTHMVTGIRTSIANREARKQGYAVRANAGESTLASRTMILGGVVIALFMVIHLWHFRLQWDHASSESLWTLTVDTLKNPVWAGFYVLAMVFLGLHLSHGFGSAFQTLGIFRPSWRAKLRSFGYAFGWIIAGGFMTFPLWALFVAEV